MLIAQGGVAAFNLVPAGIGEGAREPGVRRFDRGHFIAKAELCPFVELPTEREVRREQVVATADIPVPLAVHQEIIVHVFITQTGGEAQFAEGARPKGEGGQRGLPRVGER